MAKSAFNELWNGIGDAIADIREKVVEEPWFGRVVTERGDAQEWPKTMESQKMEPTGLNGEGLPPEPVDSPEPGSWPRIEHGTIEGHFMHEPRGWQQEHDGWPKAIEAPGNTYDVAEQNHDRDADRDIDR